jgi:nucleoid-associated protein YgaU
MSPLSLSGTKQALSITGCEIDEDTGIVDVNGQQYELLINPSEFSHERAICYNTKRTQGQASNPIKFSATKPDTISFSVVFDGTGAVPQALGSSAPSEVFDQIDTLSNIIYKYQGGKHEPSPVQVLWGKLIFYGRLKRLSTTYTLFKPNGAPLRAKADLAFIGFVSKKEGTISADRSSPDLSHSVEVREGDTLPLLCQRIYGDSRYYPEVAAFNGLREFRRLQPGARLHFPPLR